MYEIRFSNALTKGRSAYNRIADLQQKILSAPNHDIRLQVEATERTGLTFVFLLACLPMMAQDRDKRLYIRADDKIYRLMKKIHAVDFYDGTSEIDRPCFRQITGLDSIIRLVTEISGEAPVQMSEELENIMVSRMGEMYINALDHAEAKTVIGGKYFKQNSRYCFSCYDSGVGIPQKVRRFLAETEGKVGLSDTAALRWALKLGNSTVRDGTPRGVGLHTLCSFAKANDGVIRICSGQAFYEYKKGEGKFYPLDTPFVGTLFEMDIIQDNGHKYVLR